MSQFANVCYFVKQPRLAITSDCDILVSIAIIVAIYFLPNDFKTTINSIPKSGNKSINKIQQILNSAKAEFLKKKAIEVREDVAIIFEARNFGHNKRNVTNKDKQFNCQKLDYWAKNCKFPNQYQSKKTRSEDTPKNRQQLTYNLAHIAVADDDDFESEPFCFDITNMIVNIQPLRAIQYLDFFASPHLINNKELFIKDFLRPKNFDLNTAESQILYFESVGTIAIRLADASSLGLNNPAYTRDINLNPILLGPREDGITYINNVKAIIPMQTRLPIIYTKENQNLFILELASPNKAIKIIRTH